MKKSFISGHLEAILSVSARLCLGFLVLALALGFATIRQAVASDNPYKQTRASADGIGKSYMGREIARVMGWQAADWLERPERTREERPDLLLAELKLKPGMVAADIGAGSGYHSRRMAEIVGAGVAPGMVYAVDVQPEMVQMLAKLARAPRYATIKPILSAPDNVKLPRDSIDLAIMVDVYHELEYPLEVMRSLVDALKPGGRMVFVEYRAEDPDVPIRDLHKMSERQIRREAEVHQLVWERTSNVLPWQHIVVFRKNG